MSLIFGDYIASDKFQIQSDSYHNFIVGNNI